MKKNLKSCNSAGASILEFCVAVIPLSMILATLVDAGSLYFKSGLLSYVSNQISFQAADVAARQSFCPNDAYMQGQVENLVENNTLAQLLHLTSDSVDTVAVHNTEPPFIILDVTLKSRFNCVTCMFFQTQDLLANEITPVENDVLAGNCLAPPNSPPPPCGLNQAALIMVPGGFNNGMQSSFGNTNQWWEPCAVANMQHHTPDLNVS